VFFALKLSFDGPQARELSTRIQEEVYLSALEASVELAAELGPHPAFAETRASAGALQPDLWGVTPAQVERYQAIKRDVASVGLRNSLLIAIAPTATIASIAGCYECIEPQVSNLWKRETLSGDFLQVNRFLVEDLKALGLWTDSTRAALKHANGSVQQLPGLPDGLKSLYRTVWELPMRGLLDMAAERGPFIDQSQSLNLFVESPSIGALSSMYFYAWKKGLKTTYYLRSRPATEIAKTAVTLGGVVGTPPPDSKRASPGNAATATATAAATAAAAEIACSLENPESCEACQ
jgi:ribonucleoside-diphosphate reductase alpha chain